MVRTSDLTEAARRISLVAERNTPAAPEVHQGSVAIDAGRGDEAPGLETLQAHLSGDDITVAYNPSYLLDGLKVFGTEIACVLLHQMRPSPP